MSYRQPQRRAGISLMEVLISIGVIALGIFGVATLIPVAQFKVAEGTSRDRQASFGPSAAAQFRIQGMGNADNWLPPVQTYMFTGNGKFFITRGYCIDPLGLAENLPAGQVNYPEQIWRFPANSAENQSFFLPRLTLKDFKSTQPGVELALARHNFFLKDELIFDRPADQGLQPRRQYFIGPNNEPLTSVATASMSWFATLSPIVIDDPRRGSDEYLLSIVIVKDRVPLLASTDENYALVNCTAAGEIELSNSPALATEQMKMSDLRVGDWLMLSKSPGNISGGGHAEVDLHRWTQILGTSDEADEKANTVRSFTISNDDFFRPGNIANDRYSVVFMRGVKAVYERTIRLENSSLWN